MWLIFSLFVFSYLFGFVGVLVAVPIAAAIGVLVRFALKIYLASPVYSRRCADRAAGQFGSAHSNRSGPVAAEGSFAVIIRNQRRQ